MDTLRRFFFPDDTRIKVESSFDFHYDKKKQKYIVRYRFFTFRSLVAHVWGVGLVVPYRDTKQFCQQQPAFATFAAVTFLFLFFDNLKGLSNVSRLVLAGGAIAYDTSNSAHQNAGSGTTLTISLTPTGSNRVLVAGVSANTFPSGATFNGVAMTQLVQETFNRIDTIFRLVAPAASTQNLVFTNLSDVLVGGGGVNFTGADQTTPDDGSNHAHTGTGTTHPTISITTSHNNTFLFALIDVNTAETLTPDSPGVNRWDFTQDGRMAAQTYATTTAGSYTVGWTKATSEGYDLCVVGVAEVQNATLVRSASVSVSNAASRLATVSRRLIAPRALSATVSRAASRAITVMSAKVWIRTATVSVSNAVGRLAVLLGIHGWNKTSRSSDATYHPKGRSSDATYNPVQRDSDDDWHKRNRPTL